MGTTRALAVARTRTTRSRREIAIRPADRLCVILTRVSANWGKLMTTVRVAAVQATYELMDREATIDYVAELTAKAATPLVRPVTATGVVRSIVVPSPSWPAPL